MSRHRRLRHAAKWRAPLCAYQSLLRIQILVQLRFLAWDTLTRGSTGYQTIAIRNTFVRPVLQRQTTFINKRPTLLQRPNTLVHVSIIVLRKLIRRTVCRGVARLEIRALESASHQCVLTVRTSKLSASVPGQDSEIRKIPLSAFVTPREFTALLHCLVPSGNSIILIWFIGARAQESIKIFASRSSGRVQIVGATVLQRLLATLAPELRLSVLCHGIGPHHCWHVMHASKDIHRGQPSLGLCC
mmetsp:Transcript_45599/g.120555  ORF Transcript_45599/g.120555 Transcript_45599/m.120555 type:complete len:244 (-) Transcript_45599:413-1144(-)